MIQGTRYTDPNGMEYVKSDDGITIVRYLNDDADVTIPSEIEGIPVTKIGPEAFSDKTMKYIHFPEKLSMIDHHAFTDCRKIQRISFPQTLEVIGNYAFYNCWGLNEVHLPASLRSIGFGAFMNCEKITELIQDKVEGKQISIGSILDNLSQQMHVTVRHLYPDREPEIAKVIFTEYAYEVVVVVSICRQASDKPIGTGVQLRYCIGSDDIDYAKYDSMFNVVKRDDGFDTVVTVAVERLMYPYLLTSDARKTYLNYIQSFAVQTVEKYIKEDNLDKCQFVTELGLLSKDQIDKVIDYALSLDKTEYTAFLMDYRHRNFNMAEESFDL